MENVQVLIVGGGIAGISAAIWCERLGLHCILLEREANLGGQLWQIRNEIWDFPPRTYKNGEDLANELLQHRTLGRLDCRMQEELVAVDVHRRRVKTDKNEYLVDYLIIATGVDTNSMPSLAHSSRVLSPWFSTTEQSELLRNKEILVIGGGDRAVESSYNMATHASQVYLVVRDSKFRARSEWVERLHHLDNVKILMNTQVIACRDENERACVTLQTSTNNQQSVVYTDWILPRIGVKGNSEALSSLDAYGNSFFGDGFLSVNSVQSTGIDWIYGIGDITNSATYASLSLASGQAMKAVKHISLQNASR